MSQAAKKKGVSQSEFIRRVILTAADDALESGDSFGRNSPVAGAELVITERGQGQMVRDILTMKIMLARLYGEAAATKLGDADAARQDRAKIAQAVDDLVNEHGLIFE